MGFFFKSKRTSNHIDLKKPASGKTYASELDPTALLSESPKTDNNLLFTENPRSATSTGTGRSLLDDILDTFEDKKTTTPDYSYKKTSDYDFFKTDSSSRTPSSGYSNGKLNDVIKEKKFFFNSILLKKYN